MTLIADYTTWLSVQPIETVRREIERTDQAMRQVRAADDLPPPDRAAVLGVWGMKREAQQDALKRFLGIGGHSDLDLTVYGGNPAQAVPGETAARTYRAATSPRKSYLLDSERRVMFGPRKGKTAQQVVNLALAAALPGQTLRFVFTEPYRVWWLLGRTVRRLTVAFSD